MFEYKRSSTIPCSQQELFEYHSRPGAINRLIPPWENISFECRSDSLAVGSEVILRNKVFGLPLRMHAKHSALEPPERFQDILMSGPFKSWTHDHVFENLSERQSMLRDFIQYDLGFGWIGRCAVSIIHRKLEAMFDNRHRTTIADLILQNYLGPFTKGRSLRIGVTGSNGLIGHRLVDLISVLGHRAVRILRAGTVDHAIDFPLSTDAVHWDASAGFANPEQVDGLDAVVHLAGKGVATSRWTQNHKREMRDSRVLGTRALVRHLLALPSPPKALVCASGVGIYGNRGSEVLPESYPIGNDFLATMANDWESAALDFQASGRRVACGRLGIVLHPLQGALAKLLLPFKLGLGGPVGNGKQYWSWIHVDDAAAAFLFLATNPNANGSYNLVAPEQTDNRTFAGTLGKVLRRPSLVPAPASALRMILGEMADGMLLASTRADCQRLREEEFPFRAPTLEHCLKQLLGRT